MPPKSAKKGKGGPQNTPATKGKAKIAVPMDESDSEESSEQDEPPPVVKAIGSAKKTKAAAKQQEPSDEDSEDLEEDSESEEEEEEEEEKKPMVGNKRKLPQQKVQPPKMAPKGNKKQKADSEDEEDSDEDEDESEESEDEPVVDLKKPNKFQQTKAKVNGKQAQKAAAAEESSEDEEDEESEEEEPEEESEEEVKEKKKNKESVKATNAVAEGVITIFCGNLKDDCGPKELGKLFKKNGIEIADVRKNVGKRFGLVDLANASQLDAALALNQTTFQDQEIKVERSKSSSSTTGTPKPSKTPKKSQNEDCSLFVKNLADSVTEKTLKEFFSEAVEIRILKRPDGKSKGMAFIDFKDASVVETMMKKHQGAELEGQALYLDHARQKGAFKSPRESVKSRVLFVGNLSFSVTDDQLVDTFEGALSARIPTNPEGKPKGFAFIDFETVEAAQEAYDKWQGQDLEGREIKIDWAHEKGDRGRSPGGHFGGRGRGRGNFRGGRGDRGGGRGGRGGRGGGRGFGRGGGGRGGFGDKRKYSDSNFGSENKRVKVDADSD